MSEFTLLQDQVQTLIGEARNIGVAFRGLMSVLRVTKIRSLRPKSALDSALEEVDGEKRPDFYDDWAGTPSREQNELKRSIINRYEVWYNASSALIEQYLPNRWDDFAARYPYIKESLECTNTLPHGAGKPFDEGCRDQQYRRLTESFDRQIDLLQSVPDVFRIKLLRQRKLVGVDIISADLDRAQQLLEVEGTVPAAIIRAAGIIAAVALEKHLKLVADEYNSRRTSEQEAIAYTNRHGIIEMASYLGEKNLLKSRELETFKRLEITRENCIHLPSGDIMREPTKAEVAYLIQKAREYVDTEFFE